jgi:hypothetical protein
MRDESSADKITSTPKSEKSFSWDDIGVFCLVLVTLNFLMIVPYRESWRGYKEMLIESIAAALICIAIAIIVWSVLRKIIESKIVIIVTGTVVFLITLAGSNSISIYTPETFEECMLRKMEGQPRDSYLYASSVCKGKMKSAEMKNRIKDSRSKDRPLIHFT